VKVGDLVKTTGFGPNGSVGEVGLILRASQHLMLSTVRCWEVLFGSTLMVFAQDGLEAISECEKNN